MDDDEHYSEGQLDATAEAVEEKRLGKGAGDVAVTPSAHKPAGFRVLNFFRACWAELQRVDWPDRRQVGQATAVVLGFVVVAGAFLGLADVIAQKHRRPHPLRLRTSKAFMFRWYVVNTYSGHENKVKQNLEHRVVSLNQKRNVRQVVVPTESVSEMKDNQKITVEKRTMPGYVLVNMELNEDSWGLVKGTPGVTGFVGASNEPVPLTQGEVDRLLHREVAVRERKKATFAIGETVKVISGPLSDFSGEISEMNEDASRLKVLVSIFGRETPVEVGFDQVKKI